MKDPGDRQTPELPILDELQRVAQAAQPPKVRRVRTGGVRKSAARSADKPERGAK